jgi:membrane fusion protein, multidrug efflux system
MLRIAYVCAALTVLCLGGCGESAPPASTDRPVRTVTIKARTIAEPVVLTGHIRAREEIKLAFRIDGKMSERSANVGDQVKANDVLARLDPENEQNALRGSEADASAAQAALAQAKNNESRLRRSSAPREQLDQAVEQQKSAQAQVDAAQARLRMAQDRVRYTELRAEAGGIVIAKGAEPGEIVRAGQPIVVIARDNAKDAVFDVPPQMMFMKGVAPDPTVEVALSDNPRITTMGRVSEVAPQADPTTRTIPVKIALDDPPAEMRLGASVTGRISLASEPVVEIPGSALIDTEGRPAVWVVDPRQQTVALRPVRVARYEPETVIIAQGLRDGDVVVTAGVQALRPGQKVRLLGGSS